MLIANTNSREEDDQDEARVRHDFVVGRPVEPAPVVFGRARRGEREQQQQRDVVRRRQQAAHGADRYRSAEAGAAPARLPCAMAVLIASDLHKDMAGQPLLRGVSFKLERRERMTIAGRNGAGKTTLLRMLAGESRSTAAS